MYEAAVERHDHWVRVLMRTYKKALEYKKNIEFVHERYADVYCRRRRRMYKWTCGLYGEADPEVAMYKRCYVMAKY